MPHSARAAASDTDSERVGFSLRQSTDYFAPDDSGGGAVRGQISEGDLQKAVQAGASLERVVVAEVGEEFAAAVLFAGTTEWRLIVLRRYEGRKLWKDFHTLRKLLRGRGFAGAFEVHPGPEAFAPLGIPME